MIETYSCEITKVDLAANCMLVTYYAEGYEPVSVGVRLPYLDEDEEELLRKAAPHTTWELQDQMRRTVKVPEVGKRMLVRPVPVEVVPLPVISDFPIQEVNL